MLSKIDSLHPPQTHLPCSTDSQLSQSTPIHSNCSPPSNRCIALIEPLPEPGTVKNKSLFLEIRGALSHYSRLSAVSTGAIAGGIVGGIIGSVLIARNILKQRGELSANKPDINDFLLACYQCGILSGLCSGWSIAQLLFSDEEFLKLFEKA